MVRGGRSGLNIYKLSILAGMLSIYLIHRYILRPTQWVWIDSYLGDFLSVPVIGGLTEIIMQPLLGLKFRLNWKHLLFISIYLSVVFEFVLPKYSSRYTRDLYDILAYFAGALCLFAVNLKIEKYNA